jgi:hypothetical protein
MSTHTSHALQALVKAAQRQSQKERATLLKLGIEITDGIGDEPPIEPAEFADRVAQHLEEHCPLLLTTMRKGLKNLTIPLGFYELLLDRGGTLSEAGCRTLGYLENWLELIKPRLDLANLSWSNATTLPKPEQTAMELAVLAKLCQLYPDWQVEMAVNESPGQKIPEYRLSHGSRTIAFEVKRFFDDYFQPSEWDGNPDNFSIAKHRKPLKRREQLRTKLKEVPDKFKPGEINLVFVFDSSAKTLRNGDVGLAFVEKFKSENWELITAGFACSNNFGAELVAQAFVNPAVSTLPQELKQLVDWAQEPADYEEKIRGYFQT